MFPEQCLTALCSLRLQAKVLQRGVTGEAWLQCAVGNQAAAQPPAPAQAGRLARGGRLGHSLPAQTVWSQTAPPRRAGVAGGERSSSTAGAGSAPSEGGAAGLAAAGWRRQQRSP